MSATPELVRISPYTFRRLAGRHAATTGGDRGDRWHLVYTGLTRALCGARPAKRSAGWEPELGADVTCRRCRDRFWRVVRRLATASTSSRADARRPASSRPGASAAKG